MREDGMIIKLNSIEKVKEFLAIVEMTESEIDLRQHRYIVDAKSVLGIFSFDLNIPILLQFHNRNSEEIAELTEKFGKFVVDEPLQF